MTETHESERPNTRWLTVLLSAATLWFLLRAVLIALHTNPTIPPDEADHLARCLYYAGWLGLPPDTEASHSLGLIERRPFLYYWLMGKIAHLNVSGLSSLAFLRLANVALALGTLWFAWRWVQLMTDRAVTRALFAVVITNIPMFTFLSATVSYDNLANFFAAGATWALFAFMKGRAQHHIALLALVLSLGVLAKHTLIPLAALMGAVLLWNELRDRARARREWPLLLRTRSRTGAALGAIVAITALLSVELYGGNVVRYGRLMPREDQVLPLEAALQFRIFARNYTLEKYRSGEFGYAEAEASIGRIQNAGDRRGALHLLKRARAVNEGQGPVIKDRLTYAFDWTELMTERVLGIMAHALLYKHWSELLPFRLLALCALAIFIRRVSRKDAAGLVLPAVFIAGGYALLLMQVVNYANYQSGHWILASLQGRYLFPVLVPICGLYAYYGLAPFEGRVARSVAIVVGALFVLGDGPWVWLRAPAAWWTGMPG